MSYRNNCGHSLEGKWILFLQGIHVARYDKLESLLKHKKLKGLDGILMSEEERKQGSEETRKKRFRVKKNIVHPINLFYSSDHFIQPTNFTFVSTELLF